MTPKSAASLLQHEALWTAVGPEFARNGSVIRSLNNLLFSSNLKDMNVNNIVRFVQQFIGHKYSKSKLYSLAAYDLAVGASRSDFQIREVASNRSVDTLIKVKHPGKLFNHLITTLNPNSAYSHVYTDRNRNTYVDLGEEAKQNFQKIKVTDLCGGLSFANIDNWRLPTSSEIGDLVDHRLLQLRYIETLHLSKSTSGVFTSEQSKLLFSSDTDLAVIAEDASVISLSHGLVDITDTFLSVTVGPRRPLHDGTRGQIFPKYFCIHDPVV
jgi:hypothetical protein